MRREHAGRAALGQACLHRLARCDQVERIGVQHHRHAGVEHFAQQLLGRFRRAHAGAGGKSGNHPRLQQIPRRAQHQFRLLVVETGRMIRDQAEKHFARAQLQRGTPGQHHRADHAVCAAEHAHAAAVAFVEIQRAGRERLAQQSG